MTMHGSNAIPAVPRYTPNHVDTHLTPQQCRLEELMRRLEVSYRNAVTVGVASLEGQPQMRRA